MISRNRQFKGLIFLTGFVLLGNHVEGESRMEKVAYFNQPNCFKLSNGIVEVIVTTDIGPRIIRYGFAG